MDFFSVMQGEKSFRAAFCGGFDGDGHPFWECTPLPVVQIRENSDFNDLIQRDKGSLPRCLLWHGWLAALSGIGDPFGWAFGAGQVAANRLETRILGELSHGDRYSAEDSRVQMAAQPDVWTDGSLVQDDVAGVVYGGAGFHAHVIGYAWLEHRWEYLDLLPADGDTGAGC